MNVYPTFLANIKSLLDVLRTDGDSATHSELITSILENNQMAPKMPFSKQNIFFSDNQTTFATAISECLFSSPTYTDYVLTKCLKTLKNMTSQPNTEIPFRLQKFMANAPLLDDFQVNPTKAEHTAILADMVSLTFNVKVCLYSFPQNNFAGSKLECTNYANQKETVLNVLKLANNFFVSLEEASPVENEQNFNYASTELLLEASSKNSTISQDEDSQFFNSELVLIDSVRNVFDEQEEHVSVVKNLFNRTPSVGSLSDISHEEDLLSISLDVECPQL